MKKILSILAIQLSVIVITLGQTSISGVISKDSTWDIAHSPYIIEKDAIVLQEATLLIEPGVRIVFKNHVRLMVRGTIIAKGIASDSITFTSFATEPKKGDWYGIVIQNFLGGKVTLDYAKILYSQVGYAIVGAVYSNSGEIKHSLLSNNTLAIQGSLYNFLIDSCELAYNDTASVGSGKYFKNCFIHHNSIGIQDYSSYIEKSTLQYNSNYAMTAGNSLCRSLLSFNKVGISGLSYISNYTFINSSVIVDNDTGIIASNYTFFSAYNTINNRKMNVISTYYLDIQLSNTCWGTTNIDSISKKLYDVYDNVNLGRILFLPISTDCSKNESECNIVTANQGVLITDENKFSIFPNPSLGAFNILLYSEIESDIKISNLLGALVYSQNNLFKQANIDLSSQPKGIYIIQVKSGNKTSTSKLILE